MATFLVLQLFVPSDKAFALLSTLFAGNSKVDRQTSKCEIDINISNSTVGVNHSIDLRIMFSPNLYSIIEEETQGCLPILQH